MAAPDHRPAEPRPASSANEDDAQKLPPLRTPHEREVTRKSADVDSIVRQIRQELVDISSHELDLRRREQEFERQYRKLAVVARQAAEADVEDTQRELSDRTAALNAQAAEVTIRRQRLDKLAHQLRIQDSRLKQQQGELDDRAERLQQRTRTVAGRLRQQRQSLKRRLHVIRAHERELDKRVQRARDEIQRHRAELQKRQTEIETRSARLNESEQTLRRRWEELEHRLTESAARVADAQDRVRAVATAQTQLQEERRQLEAAAAQLESDRAMLRQRQTELDRRWQGTRLQREDLAHDVEELENGRRALQQQEHDLTERLERVDRREEQLNGKLAALEAQRRRLGALETELKEREAAAEQVCRRAEEIERQAQQYHEEALALREHAAARDNESRQTALALEVEREEFENDRRALEQRQIQLRQARAEQEQHLNTLRAHHEEEFEQARLALTQQVAEAQQEIMAAEAPLRPPRWWWRVAWVSCLVGGLAFGAWLTLVPLRYLASTPVEVGLAPTKGATTVPVAVPHSMLLTHRGALLDPALLVDSDVDANLVSRWQAACAEGRARATMAGDRTALVLQITGTHPRRVGELAEMVTATYKRRVEQRLTSQIADPQLAEQQDWLQQTADWQTELRRQRARDLAVLTGLPTNDQRDAALAEVKTLEADLAEISTKLAERRSSLAVLLAAPVAQGEVAGADVADALAQDALYQADYEEFYAAARQYRQELTVSMVLLADPLERVGHALTEFAESIREQQTLDPPASLAPVLEKCATSVQSAQGRVTEFATQWRLWVETVRDRHIDPDDVGSAVADLVGRQNEVSAAAQRLRAEMVKLVDTLGAQIEGLQAEGDGGTRAMVITAVLRGSHSGLAQATEAFVGATGQTSLTENVELDAHDRRLRGLQTRLNQRRDLVREKLQLEADRLARRRHSTRVEQAREQTLQLEARREERVRKLTDKLQELRTLDDTLRRRAEVEARLTATAAEMERLQRQRTDLDVRIAQAQLSRTGSPERIVVGPTTVTRLSQSRYLHAMYVGLGAFAATWLVALGLNVRTRPAPAGRQMKAPLLPVSTRPTTDEGAAQKRDD